MPEVKLMAPAELLGRGREIVRRATIQSDEDLVGWQMEAAPVKTGTLRAGIHIDEIRETADGIEAINATGGESNEYAAFVHEGTGPHVIEPRNKQALAWPGGAHPVKVVHHPGTRPNHFMSDPLLENIALYEQALAAAADEGF